MRSGETATLSGQYRSGCTCHSRLLVRRGEAGPTCPRCAQQTDWEPLKRLAGTAGALHPFPGLLSDFGVARLPAVE